MTNTRQYTSQWMVSIDVDEPPGRDQTGRMQDETALMLVMHAFLADHRVGNELRDALEGWANGRTVDRVLIMPLTATHPDHPPR